MTVLYQGAVAPEKFALTVQSHDVNGLDMTTPTAATFHVRLPSGVEITWAGVLSAATAAAVTVTRTLASGDLPELGRYMVFVAFTVSGGTVRSRPQPIEVLDRFDADDPAHGP